MANIAPKPGLRPANPRFSSGPCAKRPGWTLSALDGALLGRSHRAGGLKARLKEVIDRSRAVLGMPDPDFGERVVAAVVPGDPTSPPAPAELDAFCREGLAAYKRPRAIHFVAAPPRNAMGKVQKHELRARLGGV